MQRIALAGSPRAAATSPKGKPAAKRQKINHVRHKQQPVAQGLPSPPQQALPVLEAKLHTCQQKVLPGVEAVLQPFQQLEAVGRLATGNAPTSLSELKHFHGLMRHQRVNRSAQPQQQAGPASALQDDCTPGLPNGADSAPGAYVLPPLWSFAVMPAVLPEALQGEALQRQHLEPPPAVQPGELRVCGVTFAGDLALEAYGCMERWVCSVCIHHKPFLILAVQCGVLI